MTLLVPLIAKTHVQDCLLTFQRLLLKCLGKIGVSTNAIGRFKNYLTTRFQFVTYDGITSGKAEIHKTPF